MILINLFGPPGSGKSTGAAYIFSRLKLKEINAELATEFAKDKTWEESKEAFNNQLYIAGEQYFRITRCQDKVDIVVTDSPILLSSFYNKSKHLGKEFDAMLLNIFNSYDSLNYFIKRVKPYNPIGRHQTEEQSNQMSDVMQDFLKNNNVCYSVKEGNEKGYDEIINDILKKLEGKS